MIELKSNGQIVEELSNENMKMEKILKNQSENDENVVKNEIPNILSYYRQITDNFEAERMDFIQRLEKIEVSRNEYQKLEFSLNQKDEKIQQLEKALSDAHLYLFDEREHILKLTLENDELRIGQLNDRKRIQQLLALTHPVTEEITYFRNSIPLRVSRPFSTSNQNHEKKNTDAKNLKTLKRQFKSNQNQKNDENKNLKISLRNSEPHVLRTIYLPNDQFETMNRTIDSLRKQIFENEKLTRDRDNAYREDGRIRQHEAKSRELQLKSQCTELQRQIEEISLKYRQSVRDYLIQRHISNCEIRKLIESNSKLELQIEDQRQRTIDAETHTQQRMESTQKYERHQNDVLISQFRKQVMDREEDLSMIQEQYSVAQQLYENKIENLESKLLKLKNELKRVKTRRSLEVEGFTKDIAQVRQRVATLSRMLFSMRVSETLKLNRNIYDHNDEEEHEMLNSDAIQSLENQLENMTNRITSSSLS